MVTFNNDHNYRLKLVASHVPHPTQIEFTHIKNIINFKVHECILHASIEHLSTKILWLIIIEKYGE
jgi:hypothetical protein